MKPFGPHTLCWLVIDGKPAVQVVVENADAPGFYRCSEVLNPTRFHRLYFTNLMPVQPIPPRYKRCLFEGVAHVIGAALKAYPKAIEVDPGSLSIETFSRRIREAITAKELYGYIHPSIDDALFVKYHEELSTRPDYRKTPPVILVGTRAALRDRTVAEQGKVKNPQEAGPETNVLITNLDNLDRICRLMHDRAFHPVPNFVVSGLTPTQIDDFEARYDIAFAEVEGQPGKHCILI